MARKTETPATVRLRARVSFMDIREGDESVSVLDETVQGWLNAGFVEVIDGGETSAGPSSAEPNVLSDGPE